jgi:8-oxo-dGTP pyrophosphatase MutT (NUDIX family)
VYRRRPTGFDVALISVGDPPRWQLPKGKLDPGESIDQAAVREVREEAGLAAAIVEHLDTIEYWFQQGRGDRGVRFHKRVTFYLMRYLSGDVRDHDNEVHEARWVPLDLAITVLHFPSERRVLETAGERLTEGAAARLSAPRTPRRPTRARRPRRPARRDAPSRR